MILVVLSKVVCLVDIEKTQNLFKLNFGSKLKDVRDTLFSVRFPVNKREVTK